MAADEKAIVTFKNEISVSVKTVESAYPAYCFYFIIYNLLLIKL